MYELYNESDNDANEILDTLQNLQYDVVKVFMPAADVDASRDGRLREVRPWPFTWVAAQSLGVLWNVWTLRTPLCAAFFVQKSRMIWWELGRNTWLEQRVSS